MDTVTYPDKEVAEILKSFVCVRIEHDQRKDLVKSFGVKPLPDVRLLDPDRKELAKLVGFSSPKRLTSKCREILDQLSGKKAAGDSSTKPPLAKLRDLPVSKETLSAATQKGVGWLRESRKRGWPQDAPGFGPQDMVLYTWAVCAVDPKEADFAKLREEVLAQPLAGTYQTAFRTMALLAIDPAANREELQKCAKFLLSTQLENGQWTYGPPKAGSPPDLGDNSNTAYGLLGLLACRRAGVEVPQEAFRKVENSWRKCQNADGGWGYRTDRETASYASMTESGMGSLLLCHVISKRDPAADPALKRASAWLRDNFSVSENRKSAYQGGRLLYHLYALERLGALSGEKVVDKEWFRAGAEFLLATQGEDGSWDDGADTPVPNTCFALLFLAKASHERKAVSPDNPVVDREEAPRTR